MEIDLPTQNNEFSVTGKSEEEEIDVEETGVMHDEEKEGIAAGEEVIEVEKLVEKEEIVEVEVREKVEKLVEKKQEEKENREDEEKVEKSQESGNEAENIPEKEEAEGDEDEGGEDEDEVVVSEEDNEKVKENEKENEEEKGTEVRGGEEEEAVGVDAQDAAETVKKEKGRSFRKNMRGGRNEPRRNNRKREPAVGNGKGSDGSDENKGEIVEGTKDIAQTVEQSVIAPSGAELESTTEPATEPKPAPKEKRIPKYRGKHNNKTKTSAVEPSNDTDEKVETMEVSQEKEIQPPENGIDHHAVEEGKMRNGKGKFRRTSAKKLQSSTATATTSSSSITSPTTDQPGLAAAADTSTAVDNLESVKILEPPNQDSTPSSNPREKNTRRVPTSKRRPNNTPPSETSTTSPLSSEISPLPPTSDSPIASPDQDPSPNISKKHYRSKGPRSRQRNEEQSPLPETEEVPRQSPQLNEVSEIDDTPQFVAADNGKRNVRKYRLSKKRNTNQEMEVKEEETNLTNLVSHLSLQESSSVSLTTPSPDLKSKSEALPTQIFASTTYYKDYSDGTYHSQFRLYFTLIDALNEKKRMMEACELHKAEMESRRPKPKRYRSAKREQKIFESLHFRGEDLVIDIQEISLTETPDTYDGSFFSSQVTH